MELKNSNLLISFLAIVIILGSWRFWVIFKDFEKTRKQLNNAQFRIVQVNKEKEELKSQLNKITTELEAAYSQLQNQLKKFANLETVNAELIRAKQEFEQKVAILEQKVVNLEREKQTVEVKLHSLENLKIAIRQVERELHEQKAQQYLAKKQRQKEIDAQKLEMGNHGFLVRYGKSTYKPTIRIEVKPVN